MHNTNKNYLDLWTIFYREMVVFKRGKDIGMGQTYIDQKN